ncbi:hypothetical protein IE53DRAFT_81367 [Violaceomyces palustris]|uniref:Uncharacterized protein n=1 Tax=Violaceomyces palustris TaxID=1673888 RepID=A0ACD0NY04_9BASI|nr:hypothetical protein IE53DRAFT_81367 [Violaceomyces palustris]
MAQPMSRPAVGRPRAVRTGIPASRSGDRLHLGESSINTLKAKVPRVPSGNLAGKSKADPRSAPTRAALSDVSNRGDPVKASTYDAGHSKPGIHSRAPSVTRHEAKSRPINGSTTARRETKVRPSGAVTTVSNTNSIPDGLAAIAAGYGASSKAAPSQGLSAPARRVRGSTHDGASVPSQTYSQGDDADMEDMDRTATILDHTLNAEEIAATNRADDADSDLDKLAEIAGSDTEDDAEMYDDEDDEQNRYQGDGRGGAEEEMSEDSTASSYDDRHPSHRGAWADSERLSAEPRPESVTSAESDNFELNIDPECVVSLHPELEEAAQRKVALICARYEENVLKPRGLRAQAEREQMASRGEIPPEMAAQDDELALMGLDPEEVRDTSMVAEYASEIFTYMLRCEKETMANPNYMDFQNEIQWHMRSTLVDWLLQVHMRYHLLPETLWIAINIVDRFLSVRVVSLAKLQLVGVTAMFIAAKYEEIIAPSVEEFVFMTENGYSKEEILKGERIILSTLDFNVSTYCSPYSWVRRISKADDYDIQTRTLSKFLMEVTLIDHRFLRARPSLIAAVGMFLAKKMLGGEWDDAFVYHSNFTEEQLVPGANLLLEKLLDPAFEEQFVCRKYANKKFLKASVFARDWAHRNHRALMAAAAAAAARAEGQQ